MICSTIPGENRGPTSVRIGRGKRPADTKFCKVFGEQQKSFASSEYENNNTSAFFSEVMIFSDFPSRHYFRRTHFVRAR